MSQPTRTRPDDAPPLLTPIQIAGFIIVFVAFLMLGRFVSNQFGGGPGSGAPTPAAPPTPTVEQPGTGVPG